MFRPFSLFAVIHCTRIACAYRGGARAGGFDDRLGSEYSSELDEDGCEATRRTACRGGRGCTVGRSEELTQRCMVNACRLPGCACAYHARLWRNDHHRNADGQPTRVANLPRPCHHLRVSPDSAPHWTEPDELTSSLLQPAPPPRRQVWPRLSPPLAPCPPARAPVRLGRRLLAHHRHHHLRRRHRPDPPPRRPAQLAVGHGPRRDHRRRRGWDDPAGDQGVPRRLGVRDARLGQGWTGG